MLYSYERLLLLSFYGTCQAANLHGYRTRTIWRPRSRVYGEYGRFTRRPAFDWRARAGWSNLAEGAEFVDSALTS